MKHSTFKFVGNGKGINESAWAKDSTSTFDPIFNSLGMLINAPSEFHLARAIGLKIKGFRSEFEKELSGAVFFFRETI